MTKGPPGSRWNCESQLPPVCLARPSWSARHMGALVSDKFASCTCGSGPYDRPISVGARAQFGTRCTQKSAISWTLLGGLKIQRFCGQRVVPPLPPFSGLDSVCTVQARCRAQLSSPQTGNSKAQWNQDLCGFVPIDLCGCTKPRIITIRETSFGAGNGMFEKGYLSSKQRFRPAPPGVGRNGCHGASGRASRILPDIESLKCDHPNTEFEEES